MLAGIVSHLWWGVVAYVCAIQVHNGLVHLANAVSNLAAATKQKN